MATGIVSIAAQLEGMRSIAIALFWINLLAYALLWLLTLGRLTLYFPRFLDDFTDHARAPGFFTAVAGTGVLGSQCIVLFGQREAAFVLWGVELLLWIVITYGIFTALIVKREKPEFIRGLTAGWLVSVVATQSVSIMSNHLASAFPAHREWLVLFACVMWLVGWMLYVWIGLLVFYRYVFFSITPEDLVPTSWISMGALAITTLAGARLIMNACYLRTVEEMQPFLKGFTLLSWAMATWWIPLLVMLGVWKYGRQRYPLRYAPLYWSAVFPLGMYTVATHQLARAEDLDMLMPLPHYFVFVALLAWLATATAMLWRFARVLLQPASPASSGGA